MKTSSNNSRRAFLKTSAMAGTLLFTGMSAFSSILKGSASADASANGPAPLFTGFDQEPLPYQYNALEPIVDAATMEIHYSKHAATYAKNLKEAAIAEKVNMQASLEEVLTNVSNYSMKMRNNGGGHYNHEMFWKCMQPARSNNLPSGSLLAAIEKQFGSFENFKTSFSEAAKTMFGSGWAWLYTNASGELKIGSTANQDNPLMNIASIEHKGFPLLCLDVWEHAYYLKYQNRRIEYIQNWWNLVNWSYVEKRFKAAK